MPSPAPSATPCVLGSQISVHGTLTGEEDLVVEGRVEGNVGLAGHLVVAEPGVVEANVQVESIEIHGEVTGDIVASRAITIEKGARVTGNVRAPRVVIRDGAHFQGTVEMQFDLPEGLSKTAHR